MSRLSAKNVYLTQSHRGGGEVYQMQLMGGCMFKFIRDMKIRIKLFGMFLVSLSGFIVLFLLGYRTLDYVKVNGPIYKNIRAGKDIIADVLPPPKYIGPF